MWAAGALGQGLAAGVIAGTGYQLFQGFYIALQVGAARYNAIYGSFAALPLFLAWLQISWVIVLFGAEISFAKQNAQEHEFEADTAQVLVALHQVHALAREAPISKAITASGMINPTTG